MGRARELRFLVRRSQRRPGGGEVPSAHGQEATATTLRRLGDLSAWPVRAPAGAALAAVALAAIGLLAWIPGWASTGLLLAGLACACTVPIADGFARRAPVLEIGVAVAVVYFVLFPLRAGVVLANLDFATNSRVVEAPEGTQRLALLVALVGILAGGIAYVSPIGAWVGARVTLPRADICERPPLVAAGTVFAVGLLAEGVVLADTHFGFAHQLLAGRASGLISAATALLILGLALLTRGAAVSRDRRLLYVLGAAMLLGILLSVAGGFKEPAFISVVTPAIVWSFAPGRRLPGRGVALIGLALLAIFLLVTLWRHASDRIESAQPTRVIAELPDETLHHDWVVGGPRQFRPWHPLTDVPVIVTHRLYGFDSMVLAVRYTPDSVPHQEGATLQNLAAGLIPRILWPEKPTIGIGYWFAEAYWGTPPRVKQVPQSVPHPVELWINFGWIGVIVGLAILGIWYRFAYSALRPLESGTGAVLYAIVLVTVIPVDRDLPLVYVTLVQRLAAAGILIAAIEGGRRLLASRHAV
jgi:hypothetical protein